MELFVLLVTCLAAGGTTTYLVHRHKGNSHFKKSIGDIINLKPKGFTRLPNALLLDVSSKSPELYDWLRDTIVKDGSGAGVVRLEDGFVDIHNGFINVQIEVVDGRALDLWTHGECYRINKELWDHIKDLPAFFMYEGLKPVLA